MADSGGHWKDLANLQLLSQSELLPGVIDEAPKRGGLLTEFGLRQAMGISLKWNRSDARRAALRTNIGAQLIWSDNVSYNQQESSLQIFYDQTPLNKFVRDTYGTINNYEAQQFMELRTGIVETIEDALIYDNSAFDSQHIDDLHFWAEQNSGDGDIDEGESVLTLLNARNAGDYMKYGFDFWHMSYGLAVYIDQLYQEGIAGTGDTNTRMGTFVWAPSEAGMPMPIWRGVRINRSDYMLEEGANTGQGSDAKTKVSGSANWSMFLCKKGVGMTERDPGINIGFGGDTHQNGEFFRPEFFDKLENYDASGIRLVTYIGLMIGSTLGISRLTDISSGVPTP